MVHHDFLRGRREGSDGGGSTSRAKQFIIEFRMCRIWRAGEGERENGNLARGQQSVRKAGGA